ncbi:hypothetical protein GA0115239_12031, partial [Streptomyces sp. BpilaLS-43]
MTAPPDRTVCGPGAWSFGAVAHGSL